MILVRCNTLLPAPTAEISSHCDGAVERGRLAGCRTMIFITVFVLLMNILQLNGAEDEDVLYFEDIQSEELRREFDSAELISKTVKPSDWCKVGSLCRWTELDSHNAGGGGGGGGERGRRKAVQQHVQPLL